MLNIGRGNSPLTVSLPPSPMARLATNTCCITVVCEDKKKKQHNSQYPETKKEEGKSIILHLACWPFDGCIYILIIKHQRFNRLSQVDFGLFFKLIFLILFFNIEFIKNLMLFIYKITKEL